MASQTKAPVFLGDEISAAGFRLAGAQVRTPPAGEETSFLEWARREAPLVLITAELASRIPASALSRALAAVAPPVLVVPDVRARVLPPDLSALIRRQLGIEA